MNASDQSTGAWIFVSHSHRDLEKVRQIRNELERLGHNPLLFFLKCLEADDARLPELIRDEIKSRTFFVLCNTRASQRSKWVKQEIELVKQVTQRPRKTVVVMNLERDLKAELHKLARLSKRATIFISYAKLDLEVAERIRRALLLHDYRVWFDTHSLGAGTDLFSDIRSAIDGAVAQGFVMVLLSPASLASQFCRQETEYALKLAAQSRWSNVFPIVVAPFARVALPPHLANIQWFDLTTGPFDERIQELIRNLKTREME
jgi:hypothetical protein